MKRLLTIVLLVTCLLSLTGCSSPYSCDGTVTYEWDNGVISVGGKAVNGFSEIAGSEAKWASGIDEFRMFLEETDDLGFLSCNSQGILQDNMDSYKDSKYYTEYMGTRVTMAYNKMDKLYFVAQGSNSGNIEVLKKQLYDALSGVLLTWGNTKCVMNGKLTVGNDYDVVKVRPDCCLVPGIIKVSAGVKNECTTPYSHTQGKDTYELMYYSNGSYDYYTYDGLVIQVAAGIPLADYVTFK